MASPRNEPVTRLEPTSHGHEASRVAAPGPEGDGSRATPGGDVRLFDSPFQEEDAGAALRRGGGGRIGAVVTFTGVVRSDDADGVPVTSLAFETFPEMALDELRQIRFDAVQRFGLQGLSIWHRTDTLDVGEPIVLVAAAAPHRDSAFRAAAWTMDEVKRRVPLWKRETRADGTAAWVHGGSCTCGKKTPHA